jgi:methylated-DNA-[protein]-cysteine S-methyltransferase
MGNRRLAIRKKKTTAHRPSPTAHGLASFVFRTKLGWMGLAASAKGVRTIVLAKPSRSAVERALVQCRSSTFDVRRSGDGGGTGRRGEKNPQHRTSNLEPVLRDARRQVLRYLAGRSRALDFPVDLSGSTPFQRKVWQAAMRIPYGRARSYRWIASKIGGRRYSRAVGNALGANPVPLIVPCHRVVAHDASLGGFSCGLAVKRKLLKLEGTLALLKKGARR